MKRKQLTALICAAATMVSGAYVYAADGGSGSSSDPYGISTEADLLEIAFDPSAEYELLCDIEVSDTPSDIVFSGRLNGNGHRIEMNGSESLFSEVSGTVEDIGICGSAGNAGGLLADKLTGTVSRSVFEGSVTLSDAESGGAIAGTIEGGTVTDCRIDASVNGTASNAGSIAGKVSDSTVTNCYITGEMSASGAAAAAAIGTAENSDISGVYYDSRTSSVQYGIFVGSDTTVSVSESALMSAASYPELDFGTVWTIEEGSTEPMLISYSGAGTEAEPYRLHSFDDISNILAPTYTQGKHYRLENDIQNLIQLGGTDEAFSGSFDGNGHKLISNGYGIFNTISENGVVEDLVREISGSGRSFEIFGGIANINYGTIRNCYVSGSAASQKDCGGIAGENIGGTVIGCRFDGSVRATESGAGGIVGYNSYGTIERCFSDASVRASGHGAGGIVGDNSFGTVKDCHTAGTVNGDSEAGGIAGRLYNGSILSSYSVCNVSGNSDLGGIYGAQIENGYVENSYYRTGANNDALNADQSSSFGKDSNAMNLASTYVGFDLDAVWAIDEGRDTPALRDTEGAGTRTQPYIIRSAEDFSNIQSGRKLYYELANDISGVSGIGGEFTGALNGNGHTISASGTLFTAIGDGAYVGNIVTTGASKLAGSAQGAEIEYCTMYNGIISDTLSSCTVTGCRTIGGSTSGTASGGFAGTITGGSVTDSSVMDKTVSGTSVAGGFAATVSGARIDNCFTCNVSVTGATAGGFVGRNDGSSSINGSSSYGTVALSDYSGAFAGMNYASISSCAGYDTTEGSQLSFAGHDEGTLDACTVDTSASRGKISNTGGIGTAAAVPDIGEDTAAETPAVTLSDISGHWAESTIRSLVAAGVVSGYDDGTYKPQNPVTKGEFIKLLLAANGTAIQSGFTNYEDVNKSWAKDNVYTALSLGICDNIAGSSSVFGVDDPITRVQAAALMGRLVGDGSGGTLSFTDAAAVPEWAAVPLADCAELGLITGMDDGSFAPDNNLTRAEAAVIVERVMDL